MKPVSALAAHLDAAAESLLDGTVTPSQLERDWPEWFHLTEAFVAVSGVEDLAGAAETSTLRIGHGDALTDADRRFLERLMMWLETCAAARDQGEDC